jgi:drug/metabolite transporter (DMT)-like permease
MAVPVRLGGVFLGGLLAMLVLGLVLDGRIAVPATPLAWFATAGLALVSTVGALGLLLIGAAIAGAERAAIAGASELVTALLIGAIAFGESLEPAMLIGAGLIMVAITLAARPDKVAR